MTMDALALIAERIRAAAAAGTPLRIRGGGSKDFYGHALTGDVLDMRPFTGIVHYEPTELVVTARAGTPLTEVEAALEESGQMLAFEPPHYAAPGTATIGGCVAAGLSGPRRPYSGAVRDLVLGVRILDGNATDLRFGGEVMKNVAGYDVARLMAGALGTLGVLTEVSLKVLPRPAAELTLEFACSEDEALARMNAWATRPLPVSATAWHDGRLRVRLSGAAPAVDAARRKLGGDSVTDAGHYWTQLREQSAPFFASAAPLWRIALGSTQPPLNLPGSTLLEWNGALRWLKSEENPTAIRQAASAAGGHATLYRAADKAAGAFQPLPDAMLALHQRLKKTFDPHGILNRGRLYPDF